MLGIREISHIRSIMRGSIISKPAAFVSATLSLFGMQSTASATDFTAGVVMQKMPAEQRIVYIQGVIEGLAYARYDRDNKHLQGNAKTVTGMKCVYDWFYGKEKPMDMIYAAFGKFPSYTPATIISAMIEESCPE